MKFGDGWGKGDAVYACNSRYGNCTDYHSYFIGLARSIGIPARFAIGAAIPSERNDGGTDGYHCWAEFYADGKWWPVDISEADKFSAPACTSSVIIRPIASSSPAAADLVVDPGPACRADQLPGLPLLEVEVSRRPSRPCFCSGGRRVTTRLGADPAGTAIVQACLVGKSDLGLSVSTCDKRRFV